MNDDHTTNHELNADKTGICLSGGGALGFAHIGVLKALEENGISPGQIAGSSMGAIVGTLYAAGFTPSEMLQMIREDKLYKITKLMSIHPMSLKSGLSTHEMLRELIKELIPHNSFELLKKKMYVCVSNLNKAEWEIVESGKELDKWVAASASIPGVFEAIQEKKEYYVDGGLLNNMPAQALKQNCEVIIGVDVIPHLNDIQLKKPVDTLTYSIRIIQHKNAQKGRKLCQFLIEPKAIQKFHEFSFDAYQQIYEEGYKCTCSFIENNPSIKNVI
ncbi:MAG: patatin-like phospholipase family protein [Paludibacteraceae bacterium]|jgi:NTE family protein|nr:patatin-like phospholipase family protein [Paludibacteraceae bacterium]